jgi:hypothetical protein
LHVKFWLWLAVVLAAGVAAGMWVILPSSPPDFTGQGFTSVRIEMRRPGGGWGGVMASSDDPALITGLADVLRSGRAVVVCRCAALGRLEFRRPDGTSEQVPIMPAHDGGSVEFRAGEGRYRVSRESFLRVVGPLGLPADRWYSWPVAEPDAAAAHGGE